MPVLVAFADPKITAAQARFSAAVMSQPYMLAGYTSEVRVSGPRISFTLPSHKLCVLEVTRQ